MSPHKRLLDASDMITVLITWSCNTYSSDPAQVHILARASAAHVHKGIRTRPKIKHIAPPDTKARAHAHMLIHIFLLSNKKNIANISNTSCLPKIPRQTVQTKIRLLLKKQSDQGLPCLLFCQAFFEFQL